MLGSATWVAAGADARSAPAPALQTDDISWRAGGVRILDRVSLTVHSGEFLAVIGPNGAGKTSLLNLLSGLRRPDTGRIHLCGEEITGHSPFRRARLGLGRTFQASSVFGSLSARDNVRVALHAADRRSVPERGWRRRRRMARDQAAESYLDRVGLGHAALVPAGLLSHGDKRKLDIAMVLANKPSVILLDEPLAGTASADIPGLLTLIAGLTHEPDSCAVIMVEHHIEAVLRLADRVAVLHHGALLACDTPSAITSSPAVQEAYLGQEP